MRKIRKKKEKKMDGIKSAILDVCKNVNKKREPLIIVEDNSSEKESSCFEPKKVSVIKNNLLD